MKSNYYLNASKKLYEFNKILVKIESVIGYSIFIMIIAAISIQVVCRYLLFIPTPWAEELARFGCVGLIFIGSAHSVFIKDNVSIDLIDSFIDSKFKNPQKAKDILEKVTHFLTAFSLIIITIIYWKFFNGKLRRFEYSTAMRINMAIPMGQCLLGFILMTIHSISLLIIPKSIQE